MGKEQALDLIRIVKDRLKGMELVEISSLKYGLKAKTCAEMARMLSLAEGEVVSMGEQSIRDHDMLVTFPEHWSKEQCVNAATAIAAVMQATGTTSEMIQ